MQKSNILVIEPDEARADNIVWALIFLGYYPQMWNASLLADSAVQDWRAVYVGSLDDRDTCRGILESLEEHSKQLLLLVAADSPQAKWLTADGSAYSERLELLEFPLHYERLADAMRGLHARQSGGLPGPQRLVVNSAAMARVNGLIQQVAPFDSSVLVLGDSGTGKEMVARGIHDCSP